MTTKKTQNKKTKSSVEKNKPPKTKSNSEVEAKKTKKLVSKSDQSHRRVHAEVVEDLEESPQKDHSVEAVEFDSTSESDIENNDQIHESHDLLPAVPSSQQLTTTDPLTLYLNEIRKYPLLTREQETELAKKYYETKDPQIAQTLVKSNLRFVVKIAAEYAKFSSKLIDVIQEGNVGLMHAVKEFNPYKGNRLITYAVWWIRGYIQEFLMRQFSMVRIGTTANQRKLFYQLQRQKQELEKMTSSENISLLSEKLGIPEEEITEMAKRLNSRDVSLDKPSATHDENATPLSSLLKKEDGSLPLDEKMALEEQLSLLMSAIEGLKSQLTEKEQILLNERVLSDEPLTLQEIGDKYKITREAVRQTEARLMKKIKDAMLKIAPV